MERINKESLERARKSIRCLNFNYSFYNDVKNFGLSSEDLFHSQNRYLSNISSNFKSSGSIENDFRWLIKIGILRREVDGQGLTSKVRLTPLGRLVLEKHPEIANQKGFLFERIVQCVFRKLRMK
tara:strand:+ start:292 stop:666 length:375 start_codon:yes stop_codon:yes gene_type:complete